MVLGLLFLNGAENQGVFPRGVFFFFQAEDGIRDKLVTGVQTCALPISGLSHRRGEVGRGRRGGHGGGVSRPQAERPKARSGGPASGGETAAAGAARRD